MTGAGDSFRHRDTVGVSRRDVLAHLGLAAAVIAVQPLSASMAAAQAADGAGAFVLPLRITSLVHHIGISVRDVLKSAEFYSRVFGGSSVYGEKQPAVRYFISFKPGDAAVDAGDIAIGKLGTLGSVGKTQPLIDHLCVGAVAHDGAAWRAALEREGIKAVGGGIFFDKDAIAIQVAGARDEQMSAGEVTKMPSLYSGPALVKSTGFDHVMLRVTDPEASAQFYRKLLGLIPSSRQSGIVWFTDGDKVRLGLRKIVAGEEPGVDTYGVKVAAFDRAKVADGLRKLGATVTQMDAEGPSASLQFADIDGIKSMLTST